MARSFNELRNKMSQESQDRAKAKASEMMAEMPLHELRRARGIAQEELAQQLHVKQATVSKLERRTDMYISSLSRTITAMGGELEIIARFPDGKVKINQFKDIQPDAGEKATRA